MNRLWLVLAVIVAGATFSWSTHPRTLPAARELRPGSDPAGPAVALGRSAVFYVSPSGNDSNPGTSSRPWRTFKASLPKLECGDTLFARDGTYVEDVRQVELQACTKRSPIVVQASPGEQPVIKGLLWLARPSYWTFDGINVRWNGSNDKSEHMVKLTNGVGWTFTDAEVWGARSFAAILVTSDIAGEPSGWTISDNCVHDTAESNGDNQDHLIYVNTHDSPGGTVERNILFGAENGAGVKVGGSDQGEEGPRAIVIRYNTIFDTQENLFVIWQATDTWIERNILDKVDVSHNELLGNIRGYQLSGTGNSAQDNLGFGAGSFIYNDPGFKKVADGGGNVFPLDPDFDLESCTGFHPRSPVAQQYGRYAPERP